MRICYVLLSPTFGMHQYTASLANRMVRIGHDVHLVTTTNAPHDRYAPEVAFHTPVATRDAGFSFDGLRLWRIQRALRTICSLNPDLVHVSGAHLWNPLLLGLLRRAGIPTVHDLHDLHPHAGALYGRLLYLWNTLVRREADHILVHGDCFRQELLAEGMPPDRVTCTRLDFRTGSYEIERALDQSPPDVEYEPWALFIGRLEEYKGLDVLVAAAKQVAQQGVGVVIGGPGRLQQFVPEPLPDNVEVRNRYIIDEEAADLLRRCGVMVLPYIEASNSALVATAYSFCKPVIVTRAGALPEYVVEGETGWIIPPNDPQALVEVLQAAFGDPAELVRLGQAGRAWYERERQAWGIALQEVYAELAGDRIHSNSSDSMDKTGA